MAPPTPSPPDASVVRPAPIGQILAGLVGGGLLLTLGRQLVGSLPTFAAWIDGLGALGPVAFVLGYVVATLALVPGSVLALAAGALFGPVWGTVLVLTGAVIGSTLAFLLARSAGRATVAGWLESHPRLATIDDAVGRSGFLVVLLLRLSPAVPFTLINYALGLSGVRLRDFLAGSVGMVPGAALYIYYGALAGNVDQIAGGGPVGADTGYYAVLGLGLVTTVVVGVLLARLVRQALQKPGEN